MWHALSCWSCVMVKLSSIRIFMMWTSSCSQICGIVQVSSRICIWCSCRVQQIQESQQSGTQGHSLVSMRMDLERPVHNWYMKISLQELFWIVSVLGGGIEGVRSAGLPSHSPRTKFSEYLINLSGKTAVLVRSKHMRWGSIVDKSVLVLLNSASKESCIHNGANDTVRVCWDSWLKIVDGILYE